MISRDYAKTQIDMLPDSAIEKVITFISTLDEYLTSREATQYEVLMKEAGHDDAFLNRTLCCSEDFELVDAEISEKW